MCVSIGLTIGKVPTVGVVYNPIMDEVRILIFNISGQPLTILSMHRVIHGRLHLAHEKCPQLYAVGLLYVQTEEHLT